MLPIFYTLLFLSSQLLLQPVEAQVQNDKLSFQSAVSDCFQIDFCKYRTKKCRRPHIGLIGPTGATGAPGLVGAAGVTGSTGAAGAPGSPGLGAETVYFSMSISVAPTYDFAFLPANNFGNPNQFDPSTTNPDQRNFASTFLVPFDGTLSNLTIRLDVRSLENIDPSFTYTIYGSISTIGTSAPIGSWTSTGLAQGTGQLTISSGSSVTATFQNLADTVSVTAGTLLTVVISSTGYNMFDIQPATFSTSFKYTPNAN